MKEFTKSQKESDEKFLEEHQTNIDAELRKKEIKEDAKTLLAKSIQAGSSQQCNNLQQCNNISCSNKVG